MNKVNKITALIMQANQISEMDSISSNYTTMYVGLVK